MEVLNRTKHLTDLGNEKQDGCKTNFICDKIIIDGLSDNFKMTLIADLVTLEAIDQGNRENALEMVLQVTKFSSTLYYIIQQFIHQACNIPPF